MQQRSLGLLALFLLLTGVASPDAIASFGQASYYHDKFEGRPTASGEPYSKEELTAAHRSYAFGTRLKVTRLDTGQCVEVRVNDRGPHSPSRVVDLSRRAAEELGLISAGVAEVQIEVLEGEAPSDALSEPPIEPDDTDLEPLALPTPITWTGE